MIFSQYPACHPTAKVGNYYCCCQAGQDAKRLAAELAETQQRASLLVQSSRQRNGRVGMLEL